MRSFVSAVLLVLGGTTMPGYPALAAEGAGGAPREWDFDGDGVGERVVTGPGGDGSARIERWNAEKKTWEEAGYGLPDGVKVQDRAGRDAGLRFVDLNQDGRLDVLFSNAERFGIHLWSKDVKPHLGWVRGWSQFVKAGERRGAVGEPPSLTGAEVRVEGGDLVIRRSAGTEERHRLKGLIAFDVPPPKSTEEALATFRVREGFQVELVAAEPVVTDPVAFDWGLDGRLWVVEMRDYPLGMDGRGKPGGVVKVLEDRDGDGRYETSVPFWEDVPFPTSVMAWGGGALIAAAPDLWYAEDKDGDGRADTKRVVLTGFEPGNEQHRFNGFEWGLDGWVYAANGDSGGSIRTPGSAEGVSIRGRDIRFHPETGEFETVSAQTQYGRRRDDWGNWFGNNNPTWLWQVTVPEHYLRRNPQLAVKRVVRVLANYEDSTRVFPASAPQVRPNQPWSLNHVTSGCSPSPYRDDLFGADYATSVFICEPVHNVVHREVLHRDGPVWASRRAEGESQREFLASTDNWFRPTTVRTGPDGALYVADMYRFVLEHPEWISPEMQARLDLRAGEDRGRIYRVVPVGGRRRGIPDLTGLRGEALVAAMDSPSGWQRDGVQRRLLELKDAATHEPLAALLGLTHAPQVRVQALATLGGLGALKPARLVVSLKDPHPWVRVEALRQSERMARKGRMEGGVFEAVKALATDGDAAVRFQAAFSLGAWPRELSEPVLGTLAASDGGDEWIRVAVLSSLAPGSELFREWNQAGDQPRAAPVSAGRQPSSPDRAAVVAGYSGLDLEAADAARGRQVFETLCAVCHRFKGEGKEVGPDLAMVSGKPLDWLLVSILDPGAAVEARYVGWSITLRTGDVLEGLVAAETANNVVLRMSGGVDQAVLRSDMASMVPMSGSMMPGGFETVLAPSAMADLLRWLTEP